MCSNPFAAHDPSGIHFRNARMRNLLNATEHWRGKRILSPEVDGEEKELYAELKYDAPYPGAFVPDGSTIDVYSVNIGDPLPTPQLSRDLFKPKRDGKSSMFAPEAKKPPCDSTKLVVEPSPAIAETSKSPLSSWKTGPPELRNPRILHHTFCSIK
jgi:hypothetical protein